MKRLSHLLSLALILLLMLASTQTAVAQDSLPLVLVVRDGAGTPLVGIQLDIAVTGPPHEPYDTCYTDDEGQCTLLIPPGAYLVTFGAGWRGRNFVPVEEQNAGALSDGGLGGFGVYFEPSDAVQYVTFVIGQREEDGALVPLWDMSRDPNLPPQPFAFPASPTASQSDALSGIVLTGLDPAPSESGNSQSPSSPPTARNTQTGNVDVYGLPVAPTPIVPVAAAPTLVVAAPAAQGTGQANEVSVGGVVCAGVFLIFIVAAFAFLRARQKRAAQ